MQSGIRMILDGLPRCQDEVSEATTSSNSCWRTVPFVVAYFCDIPKGKEWFNMQRRTIVDYPGIRCLVARKASCCMNDVDIQSMAGTLSTRLEYAMVMGKVSKMEPKMYEKVRWEKS